MSLHPIDMKSMTPEIFRVFGTQNALITAGDEQGCNTMTIGWCQLGRLWNVPVCTAYVRPERYTYQFMENQEYFTVSVFPADQKQTMIYCGTQSGRDVDKIKECGLTVRYGAGGAPFFEEAEWVLVCKKIYVQDMSESCVLDSGIVMPFYGEAGGWHRIYTGLVVEAYSK